MVPSVLKSFFISSMNFVKKNFQFSWKIMLMDNSKSCLKFKVLICVEADHKSNQMFTEKNQYLLTFTVCIIQFS